MHRQSDKDFLYQSGYDTAQQFFAAARDPSIASVAVTAISGEVFGAFMKSALMRRLIVA